jgi:hypothetical protein
MKEEFDKNLVEKYPKIFANRNGDPKETLMCWGFECGDGWYPIINTLCSEIQSRIDWNNKNVDNGYGNYKEIKQVVAVQIKEKFGGLRFYYEGGDDHIHGMVRMAENWASTTCEICGNPGQTRHGFWIKTLCDEHEAERQERYKDRS